MFPLCSNCVQADSWLTGADISQVFLLTAAFFSGEFFLSAGSLIFFSVKNFLFQADDGIRDGRVTGDQTCALPILVFSVMSGRRSTLVSFMASSQPRRSRLE